MGRTILLVIGREYWPEGVANGQSPALHFGDDQVFLLHDSGHINHGENFDEIVAAREKILSAEPTETLLTVVHSGSLGPLQVRRLEFLNAVYSRLPRNENFQLVQAMLARKDGAFAQAWNRLQRDGCFGCLACVEAYRVFHGFPQIIPLGRQPRDAYEIPESHLEVCIKAIPPVVQGLRESSIPHEEILRQCDSLETWLKESPRTLAALDEIVDGVVKLLQSGCQ